SVVVAAVCFCAPASAAPIFMGSSAFVSPPGAFYFTGQQAAGVLSVGAIPATTGPSLMDVGFPQGFKYTDARVQYTSASADVGRVVSVVWTINRPFLDTTAETITIASHLDGVLTLPANTPMANVRLDTAEAFPDNPASIAELVTSNFQTGLSAFT